MSEHEVLTEVPPQLKTLVRLVARAFYMTEHTVILDILAKYPCVTEDDLSEVLKLYGTGGQKQLRQALTHLRKDKLIKSLQKMGSAVVEGHKDSERQPRLIHYYYINYKQFVNVIKYKLDQMTKKVEAEERKAQNSMSYVCPSCGSTFSDLDVDRLFDASDGNLRCSHCGTVLVEDAPETSTIDTRTRISLLNDQMRPIMALLRETENLNLAPEILEPEAQSIEKHLHAKGIKTSHGNDQYTWTTTEATNLYGSEQAVSVKIGTQEELREQNKPVVKERPEWMKYSTVHPSGDLVHDSPMDGVESPLHIGTGSGATIADHQIMADILAHEAKPGFSRLSLGGGVVVGGGLEGAEYSSSSNSEDEGKQEDSGGAMWQSTASPMESESEEEEDFTIRVGDRVVALHEVTTEMVAQMTEAERDTYTKLCQQAMSDYY